VILARATGWPSFVCDNASDDQAALDAQDRPAGQEIGLSQALDD
jgi:hypothetical protein